MVKEPKHPVVLVAACALVDEGGRVLITRRPEGKPLAGLWEFPGGKVEADELPETALIRELKEELGIDVAAANLGPLTFVSHSYPEFHLLMPVYVCRHWQGAVKANEGQEISWVSPEALAGYDMPPADEPLKGVLSDLLKTA
ncbi:MAG: 8-oxo-dGTP diphosphatase MutT [Methyloceanibacter sp.]|uniref:8-oxo-dGTP diphosphatase MutT n=1 Tax=Methyloceanibacter sp. TaxID=1965321 RepID=UPI003D6D2EAD